MIKNNYHDENIKLLDFWLCDCFILSELFLCALLLEKHLNKQQNKNTTYLTDRDTEILLLFTKRKFMILNLRKTKLIQFGCLWLYIITQREQKHI